MKTFRLAWLTVVLFIPSSILAQGVDVAKLEHEFGRPAQKIGDICKFGFPRTDLKVTVDGLTIKPGLALGSWGAFEGTEDNATVMGDLVLLQGEVNPVMSRLRSAGFEITAVHNHLINESPRVMYMHYMGHGPAEALAKTLKDALSESKTPLGKVTPPAKPASMPTFVAKVEATLGRKGSFNGGVLAFGIPRRDGVTMHGALIPPAMGVGEGINFQGAGTDRVATTGDFVLVASEVNPVISALQEHHILVTALHSHMLEEEPRLFFMHFWGAGPTQSVAEGIKSALEKVAAK